MILSEKDPDLVGKLYKITNKTLNLNLIRRTERDFLGLLTTTENNRKKKDFLSLPGKNHQIGDGHCHTHQPMQSHYFFKLNSSSVL